MLYFCFLIGLCAVCLLLVVLDAARKIRLTHPVALMLFLPPLMNLPAAGVLYNSLLHRWQVPVVWGWLYAVVLVLLCFYLTLRLHLFPYRDGKTTGIRLKAMIGGRSLVRIATLALVLQVLLQWLIWRWLAGPGGTLEGGQNIGLYIADTIYAVVFLLALFLNGAWRMLLTSRRLSVVYRVLIFVTCWVPVVNILVLHRCCRLVREEYGFALYKRELDTLRAESDLCKTRYPLVMVHGVLFRDLRFFNYWGRIPKQLMRLGATVYYGNQEAVGTVETNAADLAAKIQQVLEETGAEKVNIIAHSKGGLDARYAVSRLGLAPLVASVTTISTPHRGCRFVDKACNLPEGLYRFIAARFDNAFRRFGDKSPDFYTATRQFATAASEKFNTEVPDAAGVYYQSYMSRMRGVFSDSLLWLTYLMILPLEGANDGLVSVESAKWGEFRELYEPPRRRGITHGDIIDLKREDIRGFDVAEAYVAMVADLKAKGY